MRHGASADAIEGEEFELIEGQGDPPLSAIGREQAELVAERLSHLTFDALYVTTLRRTVETAAPFIRLSGLTPQVEPDLREVFMGDWEGGQFRQKVADADPLAVRMLTEERWDVVPGAEAGRGLLHTHSSGDRTDRRGTPRRAGGRVLTRRRHR